MTFTPLGDAAYLAYATSEEMALRFAAAVRKANPAWLEDVVPAYASVGVFFDAERVRSGDVLQFLRSLRPGSGRFTAGVEHQIPVCYEMGLDHDRIRQFTGQPLDVMITKHTSTEYTVYAVGFVPGFPYLGYLPGELSGVPRLESPRVRVEPGSVGLTGRQTGIYPLPRPGGWNILGRTPLTIVDVADEFFPIRIGDQVQFTRIDDAEFRRLQGERLSTAASP